jgi:choline dehydrogenase-like flavoprotein
VVSITDVIALSSYSHFDFTGTAGAPPVGSNICVLNILVSPSSRGTITLRSADPLDPPLLDPNILSNQVDTQLLYSVARLTSEAIEQTIDPKYGATEYAVDKEIRGNYSDSAMRQRILKMVRTINHGSGTCAMGSVVDTECRVLGIQRLRVVDSSVFPTPLSGHYQAAVYAVAEQVSISVLEVFESMLIKIQMADILSI